MVFPESWSGFGSVLTIFLSCRSPCSVSGQGSGNTPLSEAQDCRFFVVAQFCPADALLSPEPGGDQGTLFARNVVQGYVRACVSSFIYFLCVVFVLLSRLNTSPPRGAVGDAAFHPGYLSFPRLTPHHANGPWEFFLYDFSLVLAPAFPFISTRARLALVPFLWLVCRRAFSAPPPPHRRYAAGF